MGAWKTKTVTSIAIHPCVCALEYSMWLTPRASMAETVIWSRPPEPGGPQYACRRNQSGGEMLNVGQWMRRNTPRIPSMLHTALPVKC